MKNLKPAGWSATLLMLLALLPALVPAGVSAQPLHSPAAQPGSPAAPVAYTFTEIARLGDAAPGGGHFINDFEPSAINNRGMASFATDLDTAAEGGEGSFLAQGGDIIPILRTGDKAPGGGAIIGPIILGDQALNGKGDMVAAWLRDPFESPLGKNAGVYRYSHKRDKSRPVMLPGMPAPGGGTFLGAFFHASINRPGDAVFPGIISPTLGIKGNPMGLGIFKADKSGNISKVAVPGDVVPEGILDSALNPWINLPGDVAFSGHVAGEECIPVWDSAGAGDIACGESIYFKPAATGKILSIAHQGAPIRPRAGGGTFHYAWGPIVNNAGEIVFIGDLSTPPGICQVNGVFKWRAGKLTKVARPGDPMPGGGKMATATCSTLDYFINNRGDICFNIVLDTETNGTADTGLYVLSKGTVHLVARTGTVIPGIGTIATVKPPFGAGGARMNGLGQVLFQVGLTGGAQVLLLATPG
jgi:hypothetical protein